jgi:hypothetical protein
MMKAARTSEKLVNFYPAARRYNPDDSHLRILFPNADCFLCLGANLFLLIGGG